MRKKFHICIGTSGWHYKHWIGTFYPQGTKPDDQMAYYLKYFKTVELNNSFYKLPDKQTFQKWYDAVPDDFIFAVKGSRFITHMKKLKDGKESSRRFFENVVTLREKMGPILFQLPPLWHINMERLKEFLEELPNGFRYTFEFRDHSWYTEDVYTLLRECNVSFCVYELKGHMSPVVVTADFVYIRLHGPEGKYAGSYSEEVLSDWAHQCKEWQKEGKDVYIFFDNDQLGYAAFNAIRLKELVENK